MDLDYNTVKYIVIILSLIVLGYTIYLLYTELTSVKNDFNKIKTKVCSVEDEINDVKEMISIEEDIDEEDNSKDTENYTQLLNNNGFLSSLNFNYSKLTEIPDSHLEEIQEVPENEDDNEIQNEDEDDNATIKPLDQDDEIEFVTQGQNSCSFLLTSGKNKGKPCSKPTIENSNKCLKHSSKSEKII